MEPRARAGRHKSSLNFNTSDELSSLLLASGAPTHPDLQPSTHHPDSQTYIARPTTENKDHAPTTFTQPYPETVRVLDEILTDFVIETCHDAVRAAGYAGRAKLKLADFEWVLRRDAMKLGRVQEMFRKKREVDSYRKVVTEGTDVKMGVNELMELGDAVGEEGTGKGKGRGRGRRKKTAVKAVDDEDGGGAGTEDVGAVGGAGGVGKKRPGKTIPRHPKARSMVGSEDGEADFEDELIDIDDRAVKRSRSEVG